MNRIDKKLRLYAQTESLAVFVLFGELADGRISHINKIIISCRFKSNWDLQLHMEGMIRLTLAEQQSCEGEQRRSSV